MLPATGCAPPRPNGPACAARGLGRVSTEAVVVVDGSSGQVLATVPVPAQGR
jgi:D-alanyl-D-alanine carboxypeptidase